MKSIFPIEEATLAWTPSYWGKPKFKVFHHIKEPIPHEYEMTIGACNSWYGYSGKNLILQLFLELWEITARDGVPHELIHKELIRFPEYSEHISSGFRVLENLPLRPQKIGGGLARADIEPPSFSSRLYAAWTFEQGYRAGRADQAMEFELPEGCHLGAVEISEEVEG